MVWHSVRALIATASTATDGVACSWACYYHSLKGKFFKHFIVWFCLFPRGNLALFILKWTIPKNELSLSCGLSSKPSAVICLFFQSCRERRQFLFCGQGTEEFFLPFPNKEIVFDDTQLVLKRWQHILFFLIGKFHMTPVLPHESSRKEKRRVEMGTWGSRVNNAHLRHVTSRAIS